MAEVACYCGCCYSFDGDAGACPGCGEVATLRTRPAPASTTPVPGVTTPGQPAPAEDEAADSVPATVFVRAV